MQNQLKPLSSYHTRELMQILNSARACGGQWNPFEYGYGPAYTIDDIKQELSTREHIPNKKESRATRKAAAKRGR